MSPEALRKIAADMKPGAPMHRNHGRLEVARLVAAEVVEASDGELELWVDFESDIPIGEDVTSYLGRGLSAAVIEYGSDHTGNEQLLIAADALAFDDEALAEVRADLKGVVSTYVTYYHQFAEVPPPCIIVELSAALVPVLQSAAGIPVWEAIKLVCVRVFSRPKHATGQMRLIIKSPEHNIDVDAPTDPERAPAAIRAAFDGAAKVIGVGGASGADRQSD